MRITRHAESQMTRRGIGRPNILAVMIHGRETMTPKQHVMRRELEGLVVVYDDVYDVVITAFHRAQRRLR